MFQISGTFTNDEDFEETFEVYDENGLLDISAWTEVEFVFAQDGDQLVLASITNGQIVKNNAASQITVSVPLATVRGWEPGTIEVGMRYTEAGKVRQIGTGEISLIEGHFS